MMTRFFRLFIALILLNGKAATASELPILSGEDVFELQYASNSADRHHGPVSSRVAGWETHIELMQQTSHQLPAQGN